VIGSIEELAQVAGRPVSDRHEHLGEMTPLGGGGWGEGGRFEAHHL